MSRPYEEEGKSARTDFVLQITTGKGKTKGKTSNEAEVNSGRLLKGLQGQTPEKAVQSFNTTIFEQRKK